MVGLRIDWHNVPDEIRQLARKASRPARALRDWGAHLVRSWELSFPRTPTGVSSRPGRPPAIGDRGLANSLAYELRQGGTAIEAGSSAIYAGPQHRGALIRPRRAKALAIPLPDARGRRPKDFRDLHFRPASPAAKPNVIGVLGKGDEDFKPLFALAREVRLPARPWLKVSDRNWDYLGRALIRLLER